RLRAPDRDGDVGSQEVQRPDGRRNGEPPEALLPFRLVIQRARGVAGLLHVHTTRGKPATTAVVTAVVRATKCQYKLTLTISMSCSALIRRASRRAAQYSCMMTPTPTCRTVHVTNNHTIAG